MCLHKESSAKVINFSLVEIAASRTLEESVAIHKSILLQRTRKLSLIAFNTHHFFTRFLAFINRAVTLATEAPERAGSRAVASSGRLFCNEGTISSS